jgi:hypothetical protein
MGETSRWLNWAPCVLLKSDGPKLTQQCCGPGSRMLSSLRASRDMREPLLAFPNRDGRNGKEPNRVCQVSPLDGRLRLFLDNVGPTLSAFDAFEVRGFEMQNDMKLSPFELSNAETPTRLDLVPCILWMDDCHPLLHTQCALISARLH